MGKGGVYPSLFLSFRFFPPVYLQIVLLLSCRRSPNQTSPTGQDRAGPSEFQSFSDSMKSRFNALSLRYMENMLYNEF